MLKSVLYDWGGLNRALFLLINGFHSMRWDRAMRLGSWIADHRTLGLLVAIGALAFLCLSTRDIGERANLVAGFTTVYLITGVLVWAMKVALNYPRPEQALGPELATVLVVPEDPYSFPSGHAARMATVVAILSRHVSWRLRLTGVLMIAWVALSRVALGAHFPADVVAGVVVGVGVPVIFRSLMQRIARNSNQENQ